MKSSIVTVVLAWLCFISEGFSPITFRSTRSTALRARGPPRGRRNVVPQIYKPPMNDEIADGDLRVVTPTSKGKDEPLGVMSKAEALAKAKEMGNLDLLLVNNNSDPPVCKIVDYSKYRYQQEKKAKEVKKNSKATEIKEVKMSYKIDVHDYGVRKKNASKFLSQGNRVKCTVMFRGREVQHDNLGFDLLTKLSEELEELCTKEGRPKREGRSLSLILNPRPEVLKQVNANRRNQEKDKKKKRDASRKQKIEHDEPPSVDIASLKKAEEEDVDVEAILGGGDSVSDKLFG